ncbi:MAG: DUF4340 domain-containing protein [Myxococcales bacterium]|nr:DUF4340 domain-containing protein [Myxococcales bacterium]
MGTETKLYVAVGVLAVLGGALYLNSKSNKEEAESYTQAGRAAELPPITFTDDDLKKIDKLVIEKGADEDGGAPAEFELTKSGEEWKLTKPVAYKANQANVKSLLDALKRLKTSEQISSSKDQYEKFGVADGKGLHVVVYQGGTVKADLRFGEGGTRGQMARIGDKEGVFSVKGYSSFTFDRDAKGWRDLGILKFDEKEVESVDLTNEHGEYTFTKDGDKWTAKYKKPKALGAGKIDDFDSAKVGDLLRAFKALNAAGFGDGKKLADIGLEPPKGQLTIKLKEGSATHVISVGDKADGSNVYAKVNGNDQIFQISSWAADWVTAEPSKFTAKKDDKDKAEGGAKPPGGMPGGIDLSQLGGAHPGHDDE